MKFRQALMNCTLKQQRIIETFLNDWGRLSHSDRIAVDNIRNEHFMEAAAWDAFFQEMLYFDKQKKKAANKNNFFIHFKFNLHHTFQEKFILRGGLVSSHCQPQLIGAVLTYDQFVHHLLVYYPQYFTEPDEVKSHIHNMENFSSMYPHWQELMLKKAGSLIWLVWDKEKMGNGPFRGKNLNREVVCSMLGLGGRYFEGKSLLAFVFECTCRIYRPTFSDSNLSIYFKPYHKDHGMTKPLNKTFKTTDKKKLYIKGLPEGVHLSNHFQLRSLKQLYFYQ